MDIKKTPFKQTFLKAPTISTVSTIQKTKQSSQLKHKQSLPDQSLRNPQILQTAKKPTNSKQSFLNATSVFSGQKGKGAQQPRCQSPKSSRKPQSRPKSPIAQD